MTSRGERISTVEVERQSFHFIIYNQSTGHEELSADNTWRGRKCCALTGVETLDTVRLKKDC